MDDDWILNAMGCALVVLLGLLILGAVLVAVDLVQGYRAFPATVACQAQRMDAQRRAFSIDVRCTPPVIRQDTTTVNLRSTP